MKGMAAATVPAVSATPLAAASDCPSRTIPSACVRPTSGAPAAGIPEYIGTAAPDSAAPDPGTATVHFSELGPVLDDTKGRTLHLTQVTRTGHPLHCLAGDTTAGDTNAEETRASGATVVRRQRIRQQGRPRSIGD